MMRSLLVILLLSGCSAEPELPPLHPIVLQPPAPTRERLVTESPAAKVTGKAAHRLLADTAAVKARATCFVAAPTTPAPTIEQVSRLTARVNRATAMLRARHTASGFKPEDVTAARAAADDLAHSLPERTPACPSQPDVLPPERVNPVERSIP